MRGKIIRSIWGIQPKSFEDVISYMNQKHQQIVKKLYQHLDEIKADNDRIKKRIEFFQSAVTDTSLEDLPKTVFHETYPQHQFNIRFKKRLFGLNPKKVKAHIKELKRMQEDELQRLKEKLEHMIEEQENLLLQLSLYQSVVFDTDEAAPTNEQVHVLEPPVLEPVDSVQEEVTEKTTIEIIQEFQSNISQEQKQLFKESNVIPIHNKIMQKRAVPQIQQRLTVGGTDFWGEDIEDLLVQPHHLVQEHDGSTIHVTNVTQQEMPGRNESMASPAVEDQAYQLRKKYIVGKIAGTDIKDSKGIVIIEKNSVITEEMMNIAEREGKLAELIVNMLIKRVGDQNHGSC